MSHLILSTTHNQPPTIPYKISNAHLTKPRHLYKIINIENFSLEYLDDLTYYDTVISPAIPDSSMAMEIESIIDEEMLNMLQTKYGYTKEFLLNEDNVLDEHPVLSENWNINKLLRNSETNTIGSNNTSQNTKSSTTSQNIDSSTTSENTKSSTTSQNIKSSTTSQNIKSSTTSQNMNSATTSVNTSNTSDIHEKTTNIIGESLYNYSAFINGDYSVPADPKDVILKRVNVLSRLNKGEKFLEEIEKNLGKISGEIVHFEQVNSVNVLRSLSARKRILLDQIEQCRKRAK